MTEPEPTTAEQFAAAVEEMFAALEAPLLADVDDPTTDDLHNLMADIAADNERDH